MGNTSASRPGSLASCVPTTLTVGVVFLLLLVMLVNADGIVKVMVMGPAPRSDAGVEARAPARRLARRGAAGGGGGPDSKRADEGGARTGAIGGASEEVAVYSVSAGAWACAAIQATTASWLRAPCTSDDAGRAYVAHAAASNAASARAAPSGQSRTAPSRGGGLPSDKRRAPAEGPDGGRVDKPSTREPDQRGNQTRRNMRRVPRERNVATRRAMAPWQRREGRVVLQPTWSRHRGNSATEAVGCSAMPRAVLGSAGEPSGRRRRRKAWLTAVATAARKGRIEEVVLPHGCVVRDGEGHLREQRQHHSTSVPNPATAARRSCIAGLVHLHGRVVARNARGAPELRPTAGGSR